MTDTSWNIFESSSTDYTIDILNNDYFRYHHYNYKRSTHCSHITSIDSRRTLSNMNENVNTNSSLMHGLIRYPSEATDRGLCDKSHTSNHSTFLATSRNYGILLRKYTEPIGIVCISSQREERRCPYTVRRTQPVVRHRILFDMREYNTRSMIGILWNKYRRTEDNINNINIVIFFFFVCEKYTATLLILRCTHGKSICI